MGANGGGKSGGKETSLKKKTKQQAVSKYILSIIMVTLHSLLAFWLSEQHCELGSVIFSKTFQVRKSLLSEVPGLANKLEGPDCA